MIKYAFREDKVLAFKGSKEANPQVIGEALERISATHEGRLMPADVVEEAKRPRSSLHKFFEWDDKVAAHSFRLEQARDIVQSIHVVGDDEDIEPARAFMSITDGAGRSYRSLGEVMASADLQLKVLQAAERDLATFEARYRSLADICSLVRKARERVKSRQSKLESRA